MGGTWNKNWLGNEYAFGYMSNFEKKLRSSYTGNSVFLSYDIITESSNEDLVGKTILTAIVGSDVYVVAINYGSGAYSIILPSFANNAVCNTRETGLLNSSTTIKSHRVDVQTGVEDGFIFVDSVNDCNYTPLNIQ